MNYNGPLSETVHESDGLSHHVDRPNPFMTCRGGLSMTWTVHRIRHLLIIDLVAKYTIISNDLDFSNKKN